MKSLPTTWLASSSPPSASSVGGGMTKEEEEEMMRDRGMHESYTAFELPLASDKDLLEKYVNVSGGVRTGKLLEHLDSLAGAVAYRHCLPSSASSPTIVSSETFLKASSKAGLYLATASADRLDMFKKLGRENIMDLKYSGLVTYTGNSSMEVFVKMEGTVPGASDPPETLLLGRFSMVCRDSRTHKARRVPALKVESENERDLWKIGEDHKRRKNESSMSALDKVPPSSEEAKELHSLMLQMVDHRKTLDGEEIVQMKDTKIESVQLMFPQDRNLHGKVFGGILMRLVSELSNTRTQLKGFIQAFELCFTNAAIFASAPMRFLALDQITFRLPVPIGAVLRLSSKVVKTTKPHEGLDGEAKAHITVRCEVEEVDTGIRRETNTFSFTMAKEDHTALGKTVVPSTYVEAMHYLEGKRRLKRGDEMRRLYGAGQM
ncbi:acyl-coenzyme A thioesterase 9, partial [Tremellales sp. Uapishka_1]